MLPFLIILEEYHLFSADAARTDIGRPTLCTQVATAGKRGLRFIFSNQLLNFPEEILGNLGCRIVMRLSNPKCLWVAQRSMGLTPEQAARLPELGFREALVQYGDHPTPFKVRVDELSFPPPPAEATLEEAAQAFLASVRWAEEAAVHEPPEDLPITGDALKLFMRLAEHSDETTSERCDALGMDRAQEVRARKVLDAKGFAAALEQTLGKQTKFYHLTDKGVAWARQRNIKVKEYKSGPLHEYLLNQVEKAIGTVSPKFSFQRNSPIAREHGLEPDSVLHLPGGQRVIIEVCCSNPDYDAMNITREMGVDGVDLVIAVAANRRLMRILKAAVDRYCNEDSAAAAPKPLVLLDAGECLNKDFDWHGIFERPL